MVTVNTPALTLVNQMMMDINHLLVTHEGGAFTRTEAQRLSDAWSALYDFRQSVEARQAGDRVIAGPH
jgi:hypothetical protein